MLRRRVLPGGATGRWIGKNLIYTDHMGHDEPAYDADNPILRGGQPVAETEYLTDAFTREAVDFIGRHQDKPFFLYLAYNAVHSPLQGAFLYMQKFASIENIHRRIFAAMLANLDDSVGAVLKKVREEGLEQKTLIFFLSDNGGPTRELTSSNLPLRGGKGQMYEGGLRVPFMLQWKGRLPQNMLYNQPISSMDILPTVLGAAQAPMPKNLDGVNLLPYLTGKKTDAPHDRFFWRQGNKTALRQGNWKLVNMRGNLKQPRWELYHLAEDLSEQTDLAQQEVEKRRELESLWKALNAEMKEALF
jgi:arylsulfatase B